MDSLTYDGAQDLARQIQDYWSKLGYPLPKMTVEEIVRERTDKKVGKLKLWAVRSDMVRGFPG